METESISGPVTSLEAHVPRDWWRRVFNELYLKTDGDVVENDANTMREVDAVQRTLALRPGDHVLDLCCGQGRHTLELARRGMRNVVGVDQSSYLISVADARARAGGHEVAFHEADARDLPSGEASFDAVLLMGNSFGYFHDVGDDVQVLREIRRVLRPGGALVMDLSDGDWLREHFEPRSWEWIDDRLFVCRERSLSGDRTRLVCREIVADVRAGVVADEFYAMRLYTRRTLFQALGMAGFACVVDRGGIATASDRNQDLGFMARRLFMTAVRPPHAS
jgi:D-alanine-D-alanine ligase